MQSSAEIQWTNTLIWSFRYRAVRDHPQGLLRVLIMLIWTDFPALRGGTGPLSARHGRVLLRCWKGVHCLSAAWQWGQFTKWRRSGSAGHFCTRVNAGCMAGCMRPRKTHPGRATSYSFCLKTPRLILTDELCVLKTWKIKRQNELEQDNSIFFGSMIASSVGLRTTCNTAERLLRWGGLRLSAASDAFTWSCFPTRKKFRHLVFWLFCFCVCGCWVLSPSHGHLASTR